MKMVAIDFKIYDLHIWGGPLSLCNYAKAACVPQNITFATKFSLSSIYYGEKNVWPLLLQRWVVECIWPMPGAIAQAREEGFQCPPSCPSPATSKLEYSVQNSRTTDWRWFSCRNSTHFNAVCREECAGGLCLVLSCRRGGAHLAVTISSPTMSWVSFCQSATSGQWEQEMGNISQNSCLGIDRTYWHLVSP